jgi:cardiolipin synthase (CMP-forming)
MPEPEHTMSAELILTMGAATAKPNDSTNHSKTHLARLMLARHKSSMSRFYDKAQCTMFWNLPTLFTWARIVAIPLIVGMYYLPVPEAQLNLWASILFVVVALTDWLDGWLARRMKLTSAFGAFLDPVADKFLVCATLLILLKLQRVDVMVALIIIGREIAISALREWMAQIGASKSVAVHFVGKLKTATQMAAICLLLFAGDLAFMSLPFSARELGTWLIRLSCVLTIWSMIYYLQKAIPIIKAKVK